MNKQMTIGNTIKDKRISLNVKQEDLAEQIGVTVQTVSKWERDITEPKASQVHKLSKILKLSEKEICQGSTINSDIDPMEFSRKVDMLIKNIPHMEMLIGMYEFIDDKEGFLEMLVEASDYPNEIFDIAEIENCEMYLNWIEEGTMKFTDENQKQMAIKHYKSRIKKIKSKA
jgi:transcriptional regulator with XRE-family HTH domain